MPKTNKVTGDWRRWHNEELHGLNSSPSVIRVTKSRGLRLASHVACVGNRRSAYRILMGKPEGKRPLPKPRRRCKDTIKTDFQEI